MSAAFGDRASEVGRWPDPDDGYVPADGVCTPDVAGFRRRGPRSHFWNCGGVGEPLLVAVPTIAGRVGGLPEVVIDGFTGKLAGIRDPRELARAVRDVFDDHEHYRGLARAGRNLAATMFNVERTSPEVFEIYRHILDANHPRPPEFDSMAHARDAAVPSSEEMVHGFC